MPSSRPELSAAVDGIHPYVSPWKKWALGSFVLTSIFSVIFAVLTITSYTAFRSLTSELSEKADAPTRVPSDVWSSVFRAAAASAGFASILTIMCIAMATLLLFCSRKSVAHPNRILSKSFLIASTWYTALHVLNIAYQYDCYQPLMRFFTTDAQLTFNTRHLTATVVFGYITALLYFAFGFTLMMWSEKPDVFQVDRAPAGAV